MLNRTSLIVSAIVTGAAAILVASLGEETWRSWFTISGTMSFLALSVEKPNAHDPQP